MVSGTVYAGFMGACVALIARVAGRGINDGTDLGGSVLGIAEEVAAMGGHGPGAIPAPVPFRRDEGASWGHSSGIGTLEGSRSAVPGEGGRRARRAAFRVGAGNVDRQDVRRGCRRTAAIRP